MKLNRIGRSETDFEAIIVLTETELLDVKEDYEKLAERSTNYREIARYCRIVNNLSEIYEQSRPLWDKLEEEHDE